MNEITGLITASNAARAAGERYALATIVRVEGSAYRRPGARMLITESGRTTGLISGGCLDSDVRERAAAAIENGRPLVVRYDTSKDEDLVWGLGLGCNGVVEVLIEPSTDSTVELLHFLDAASRSRSRAALAKVIRSEVPELPLGAAVMLSFDGGFSSAAAPAAHDITSQILKDVETAVRNGVSSITRYGHRAEVETFIELVEPRPPLVILGAGADALPLVQVARHLGWHTTVVDTLARARTLARFSEADAVILCGPEELSTSVAIVESSVVVLMTHNYDHDLRLLPVLLGSPARYVGCLGPRRRTERLLSELGNPSVDEGLARLHAPIGLDLGAETPSEIAASIVAEVLATIKARSADSLRNNRGPIHGHGQRPDSRWDQASTAMASQALTHSRAAIA